MTAQVARRAKWVVALIFWVGLTFVPATPADAQQAAPGKPNILVLFGDDVGFWNVSAYNHGMMGYHTPNIDRIAKEGALFTDAYAQQSCTAGRAAFITGQSPIRTGLLKVGLPSAPEGLSDKDPTIANLLKASGIRDRPVRQESPRRSQRVHPDCSRLRRVLRQLLSPQRRRGAREPGLPEGPEVQSHVWSAGRVSLLGDRRCQHAARRRALRQMGQAALRGHGPAD